MKILLIFSYIDPIIYDSIQPMEPVIIPPVIIPIEDVIDLHLFRPAEVTDLLDNYFRECIQAGILSLRVIHGKGKGVLKKTVHHLLKKHPLVLSFSDAPPDAGGWGATIVTLRVKKVCND